MRRCRLRRSRYVGQEWVHLGHLLNASGLNAVRLGEWFTDTPRRPRHSPFARMLAEPLAA